MLEHSTICTHTDFIDMQDYDDVAWDRDDEVYEKAILSLRRSITCEKLEILTSKKCGRQPP
jgi:hypothetical protein